MTLELKQPAATPGGERVAAHLDSFEPVIAPVARRPEVRGKFLFVGDEKLWLRGVTYGTFGVHDEGGYPRPDMVAADFRAMARAGLNAVRVYTVPPLWLLDLAAKNGLRVMVGLPWEQHVGFLENAAKAQDIVERVRTLVRVCAGHPALLCYAIGNEIPSSVVRWYGRKRVTHFLRKLAGVVRQEDPTALITYVNFPTTEYLELPFIDFLSFKVYLEDRHTLRRYLARLQNLAGERQMDWVVQGVIITDPGQSAQLGLRDGDLVRQVNGVEIDNVATLQRVIAAQRWDIVIQRGDRVLTLSL